MKKLLLLLFAVSLLMGFTAGSTNAQTGYNAVLEFCTGTWCQWCPCGDQVAEAILQSWPNSLVLAYHGPLNYGGDPFTNFNGHEIINLMGFSAYPTGIVDRMTGIISRSAWQNQATIHSSTIEPSISYAVTKTYNSSTRQLNVTVVSTALRSIDTACNINFIITEDNVVYNQTGNGSCPGSGTYIHKWIVRNMVNGATGEQLNSGHWGASTTITKNWTTTIDNAWVASNCNVAVFAYFTSSSLSTSSNIQQSNIQSMVPTGVGNQHQIPANYALSQNYPNPFNPTTNISFSIPKDGNVSFKIYDMLGNLVETYLDGFVKAGSYNAEINASNWASGVYFYTLISGNFVETKKMMLVK